MYNEYHMNLEKTMKKKKVSLEGKRENQDGNIEDIQVINMCVKFILACSEESAHLLYSHSYRLAWYCSGLWGATFKILRSMLYWLILKDLLLDQILG